MPTDIDWAWIGGLFEGEGTITFVGETGVSCRLSSTDKDVIETLERLVPATGVKPYTHEKENWSDYWAWQIHTRDAVRAFLLGIKPWVHSRRGARLDEALTRLASNRGPAAQRTHCPQGHPLSGDNLRIYDGRRYCRACSKVHKTNHAEKVRARAAA